MPLDHVDIRRAADLIHGSHYLTVLTGAGVSKESGVPTFRDALDGLWSQYDPTQLANAAPFRNNPKLVWDFYEYRRAIMRPAKPNPGQYALAELERRLPHMQLITQNVDDLHEQAGSKNVIRLHGRMNANKCSANCKGNPTPVDVALVKWDGESGPPSCPYCGSPVRPDVVWFGELLPAEQLQAANAACEMADVMLVIGTSGVVRPAADMPYYAKQRGATVIEINPVESEITPIADLWLAGPSGEILPRVLTALNDHA
jgi:NAD-dependent deacetylase